MDTFHRSQSMAEFDLAVEEFKGQVLTEESFDILYSRCGGEYSEIQLRFAIGDSFENVDCLINSFPQDETEASVSLNLQGLRDFYQKLLKLSDSLEWLDDAIKQLMEGLAKTTVRPEMIKVFIIVLEYPDLAVLRRLLVILPNLCLAMAKLPIKSQADLARFWSRHADIRRLADMFKKFSGFKATEWNQARGTAEEKELMEVLASASQCLRIVFYSNILGGDLDPEPSATEDSDPLGKELDICVLDCKNPPVPFAVFAGSYVDRLDFPDQDSLESENDMFWTYPFMFSGSAKAKYLYHYLERKQEERQEDTLKLKVRRDHILEDAFTALEEISQTASGKLKNRLKVEIEGEPAVDDGGVSQEALRRVVEELFQPERGMFISDGDSALFWLDPMSIEKDREFTLMGIVAGLALFNKCLLGLNLPEVFYRKLKGKTGTFPDLANSHPPLFRSLKDLREHEGNVEDDLMLTFQISLRSQGVNMVTCDLKEGGETIPVTNENREEFVELYADHVLNVTVRRQFEAFSTGFTMVVGELKRLFGPEELEMFVCGASIDFEVLKGSTVYSDGYTADSDVIINFWQTVLSFTEDQKRHFLLFVTGADRMSLDEVKMTIRKSGPDTESLPTASTCFKMLSLPEYSTQKILREKLTKAITHSTGFGFI